MTDTLQQRQHRLGKTQLEQRIVARDHLGLCATVDKNLRPRLGRLARTHMRQHPILIEHTLDQHLQLAAGRLLAEQTRRDYPRVVEHHQITRAQLLQYIGELAMAQRTRWPVKLQQAAGTCLLYTSPSPRD